MKLAEINMSILTTFIIVHLITLAAIAASDFHWSYLLWTFGVYCIRWLGFTCAVHRYFSHRVCRTSRWFQLLLAIWGTLTMARSPIRFAAGHRQHHIHSDSPRDLHSKKQHGLFRAYLGWVISKDYHEDILGRVNDLKRYPELVLASKYYFVPNIVLLGLLYIAAGAPALIYGGLLSIVMVWHMAFAMTVMFHSIGKPAYITHDESRNSFVLALATFGEGWHNNHHANMASARMGHKRSEPDLGYLVFVALEWAGLVWDVNKTTTPRFYSPITEPKAKDIPERPGISAVDPVHETEIAA